MEASTTSYSLAGESRKHWLIIGVDLFDSHSIHLNIPEIDLLPD